METLLNLSSKENSVDIENKNYQLYRCPKCFFIQYINLINQNNKLELSFNCQNEHKYNINYLEFKKRENINFEKIKCSLCFKEKNQNNLYYCCENHNFICNECNINHKNCCLITLKDFDQKCHIHNTSIFFFCRDCEKEICYRCISNKHFNHNTYEIHGIKKDKIEEIEKKIILMENFVNDLKSQIQIKIKKIEEYIKKLYEDYEKYIQFYQFQIDLEKNFLKIYKIKQSQNQLSYPIISNLKNFHYYFCNFSFRKNYLIKKIDELLFLFSKDNFLNSIKFNDEYYSSPSASGKNDILLKTSDTTNSYNNSSKNSDKTNSPKNSLNSSSNTNSLISSNLSSKSTLSNKNLYDKHNSNYSNGNKEKNLNILKKEKEEKLISKSKEKGNSFKNRNNIITIQSNDYIISILFIKDNQLISGSQKGKISLYSKEKYKILSEINPHKESLNYLYNLNDNKILCSSSDFKISIILINNISLQLIEFIKGHKDSVNQAIKLSNDLIYSSSSDKTFRIWGNNVESNKYEEILQKKFNFIINGFIELNDEIVGNSFYKEKIIFFDKSLEIKNQISDIKCGSLPSSIISVNKDLLFIGGEAIYIIQISEKKVINYIAFDSNCYKKCLFFDYENNEIIIGDERGRLSLYYLDNNQYEEIKDKKFSCVDNIYSIVKSNNGIIAICSKDIILWGLN